jgi:translocation and assembly module TamB
VSRRVWRWSVAAVVAASLSIVGLAYWIVATESGTRWAFARALPLLPAQMSIGEVSGTLLDGVALKTTSWTDEQQTVRVNLLATDFALLPILRREIRIGELDIQGVEILLRDRPPKDDPDEPFALDLPLAVTVDNATITNIQVDSSDMQLVIDRVELAGSLSGSDLQIRRLAVQSELGDLTATASGRLAHPFNANATAAWTLRLPEQPAMSGTLRLRGDAARYNVNHELLDPYAILTEGQLALVDDGFTFDLANSWSNVDVVLGDGRNLQFKDGNLRITGDPGDFTYETRSNLLMEGVPPLVITAVGSRAAEALNIRALSVWSERGQVSANGQVMMSPGSPWTLAFQVTDLDASLADQRLSGGVNAVGTTNGRIDNGKAVASVIISDLNGDLNGYTVAGGAELALADALLRIQNAVVRVGDNRARFNASVGEQLRIDATFELARLSQLGLDVAGSLTGDIRVATGADAFEVSGTVNGAGLAWQDYSAASLTAEFAMPLTGRGTAKVQLDDARTGDLALKTVALNVVGSAADHQLSANIVTQDVRAEAQFNARYFEQRWDGSVEKLAVTGQLLGEWLLQDRADYSVSATGFALNKTCLVASANDGRACATLRSVDAGPLSFDVAFNAMPIAALPIILPDGAIIDGFIEANANGELIGGRLNANAQLKLRDFRLRTVFEGDEITATFERALADATILDNRLDGQLEFRLVDSDDHLTSEIRVTDVFNPRSSIGGRANLELNDLNLLTFFNPSVTEPTGRVSGSVDIAGSLYAPEIIGEIGLQNGAFGIRRAGITVTEIGIGLRQTTPGRLAVSGSARSGDGVLTIEGETSFNADAGLRTELRLDGNDFLLVRLPDWQITASPAISVVIGERTAQIRGDLAIPQANITFRELPENVARPSSDVVIHRGEEAAQVRQFVVDLDVRTRLGDDVTLSGFGLSTGLEGAVRVVGRSDTTYTSTGRLVLRDGSYSAYGQTLNIDSGELIFNGPLSNPTLNVRATRKASDNTVAGILLTGTPTQPRSQVYSEPVLSDVEALSYLLTGRPLSNADAEQGDMLGQAAFALGLSSAGSVVSRVRNDLGLETLGVQGSAENRQFFAGKRFGNRLFVEYAYGIVDNIGSLLLRYQLSNRLVVESRSGAVRNVDIVYSVKKP